MTDNFFNFVFFFLKIFKFLIKISQNSQKIINKISKTCSLRHFYKEKKMNKYIMISDTYEPKRLKIQ